MPSFDFSSEADMEALKNAINVASRQIDARYDFKGTSAKIEPTIGAAMVEPYAL